MFFNLGDVLLADHMFTMFNVFDRFSYKDSFTLTARLWLTYESFILFCATVRLKVVVTERLLNLLYFI